MNQLISVIIPVLNRQDEIGACIDSVFAQTHTNWEILIIDSGSTDRTLEICRSLADTDPRIRLLSGNPGVSAARNKGLEAAQGKYIFFLDSDDVIHPALLQTLAEAMEAANAKLGGSGVINIANHQWDALISEALDDHSVGQTKLVTNEKAIHAMFRSTTPINLIGGVMMRRDLVADTRFREDLHIGEDFYFIYENLIKGTDVIFLKQRWYYARIHAGNLSHDHSFGGFRSRFDRRRLVWCSEEALGRYDNARLQKEDALDSYLRCLKANPTLNNDTKQMQVVMKAHKREIKPGLSGRHRLLFSLSVSFPRLYLGLFGKK